MSAPLSLRAGGMRVVCDVARGATITSLFDEASGLEALWVRDAPDGAPFTRALGPGGAASVTSFLDRFGGGWFDMIPAVGFPDAEDGAGLLHGEACRLPWVVDDHDAVAPRLVCSVDLVRTPLRVTKTLDVAADGALRIALTLENLGAVAADYAWGTHPCFSRAAFAGGTIVLEAAAAAVPDPPHLPEHHRLAAGAFTWPHAPGAGGTVDLARIPDTATGTGDHACLTPSDGAFTLTAPRDGRALSVTFDREAFPYILLWQDLGAPAGFPFWGAADTFALEPSSNPGRDAADLAAAGASRRLTPGGRVTAELTVRWHEI